VYFAERIASSSLSPVSGPGGWALFAAVLRPLAVVVRARAASLAGAAEGFPAGLATAARVPAGLAPAGRAPGAFAPGFPAAFFWTAVPSALAFARGLGARSAAEPFPAFFLLAMAPEYRRAPRGRQGEKSRS
jgi:hypothetical protein